MSSPDLSAIVPPHTRVRLTYALSWQVVSIGEPQWLVDQVNAAWQGYDKAVLYQPATAPVAAPSTVLGAYSNAYTTLDVLTAYSIPTMTWDQFLAPLRRLTPALFDILHIGDAATLNDTQLVESGTAAQQAAANTQATTQAVARAPTDPLLSFTGGLQSLITSLSRNLPLILVAVTVAGVVVLWPRLSHSHSE